MSMIAKCLWMRPGIWALPPSITPIWKPRESGLQNLGYSKTETTPSPGSIGLVSAPKLLQLLVNCVPVNNIPPCRDVFGTAILILQIVSVFPDIQTKDRLLSFHVGAILIGRRSNLKLAG